MSLKARIEAVIYAAEEPITLAQLATLFREEALARRAARIAPQADPEAPTEIAPEPAAAIMAELLPSEPGSPDPADSTETATAGHLQNDRSHVPSELAAQNSSDAALAVPDFAGEPQPFPNQPPETTTTGRENDAGLPPETRPGAPATQAPPEPSAAQPLSEAPAEAIPFEKENEAQSAQRIARQLDREVRAEIRSIIDELIADYSSSDHGLEIREVAGGFRFGTRPEYHDAVRAFVKSLKPPMKLSLQALETLAVIAYKQPVTAPEISEIRGVDSGGVLGSLVARKLITTAGRKQVIGRPILYKTTREFLLRFGLKDLNELPSIEEFEKMASELNEPEEESATEALAAAEELPFAQNEIAVLEEAAESMPDPEANPPSIREPEPAEPPPPVSEPEPDDEPQPKPDPEPLPDSEHARGGPGSGDPTPPPEKNAATSALSGEDHEA